MKYSKKHILLNLFSEHDFENPNIVIRVNNWGIKANVSQEILNWHSLRHSHSADF